MTTTETRRNFYVTKCLENERQLCFMETKYLFDNPRPSRCFFSDREITPSVSPYIKHHISIVRSEDRFEKLLEYVREHNREYVNYRFVYFGFETQQINHREWTKKIIQLSAAIPGEVDMENPQLLLAFTKVSDTWIIGKYQANDMSWKAHDKKPHTNSHSLGLRTARAVVNIATQGKNDCRIIDPCCGIGTVIIEALTLGKNIQGYEISPNIAAKAQENLAHFGLKNVIQNCDMHTTTEVFDLGIVDIPYGIFTPFTKNAQIELLKTARRITKRAVIITFEDMTDILIHSGFHLADSCKVLKGKFIRYISICE